VLSGLDDMKADGDRAGLGDPNAGRLHLALKGRRCRRDGVITWLEMHGKRSVGLDARRHLSPAGRREDEQCGHRRCFAWLVRGQVGLGPRSRVPVTFWAGPPDDGASAGAVPHATAKARDNAATVARATRPILRPQKMRSLRGSGHLVRLWSAVGVVDRRHQPAQSGLRLLLVGVNCQGEHC